MSATITYPDTGRGAWNSKGVGGTLNAKGDGPGRYYRAPATKDIPIIGRAGYRANRDNTEIDISDYAVYRAVMAIQDALIDLGYEPGTADGLWGTKTDAAVRAFQAKQRIIVDGLFGPQTSRALFEPFARMAASEADSDHAETLTLIMRGTIGTESLWDPGAVGAADSHDLGLGQINGPAHPTLRPNDCLNPNMALPWIARFIDSNLVAFNYNTRDAIAAFNLGQGGTRRWISQGRPDLYSPPGQGPRNMRTYIDRVLAAAE